MGLSLGCYPIKDKVAKSEYQSFSILTERNDLGHAPPTWCIASQKGNQKHYELPDGNPCYHLSRLVRTWNEPNQSLGSNYQITGNMGEENQAKVTARMQSARRKMWKVLQK